MVRLAPSASNRQPWRIIAGRSRKDFHFFLERTPGYNNNRFVKSDLQRVDMGIAMCHFELAMKESGFNGYMDNHEAAGYKCFCGMGIRRILELMLY